MKKILAIVLSLMLVLGASVSLAEGLKIGATIQVFPDSFGQTP